MLGIIGGTGFGEFAGLADITSENVETPYGHTYVEVGLLGGRPVTFLPRHGHPAQFPPHRINYLANIHALHHLGITELVAVNAVGTVNEALAVPQLVLPDQLIDYTWGRVSTFFEEEIHHIDFTYPFDEGLRQRLLAFAGELTVPVADTGVYGCTQGPRLETAAEIRRLRQDGCDIVGMTAMPEAALAREKDLPYASLCVTVNAGAGINDQVVSFEEISAAIGGGMAAVREMLTAYASQAPV